MTQPQPEHVPSRQLRSPDMPLDPEAVDEPTEPSGAVLTVSGAYRPSSAPTAQFDCLVLAEVRAEARSQLATLLARIAGETHAAMRGAPLPDALLPFHALPGLHYARVVQLEHAGRTWLAFGTDYDGPEGEVCAPARAFELHLQQLTPLHHGLDRLFLCCEGYRSGQVARFIRKHRVAARTAYVGAPGRSCQQIRWEAALAARVKALVAREDLRALAPEALRARVRQELVEAGQPLPSFPPQPRREWRFRLFEIVALAGLSLALLLTIEALHRGLHLDRLYAFLSVAGLLGLLVWRFRHLEQTDPQYQPRATAAAHHELEQHAHDENLYFQNQLTHLVRIKPGPLRWLLIRVVFVALQLRATYVYNRGKLGDIPSIHFARWALIPGRGVLFFSNFDSSWQSYLGDFIDKASAGLTAVWSNTVEYPRSRWLLRAGSRDASRFLAWTRHHQQPSQVWYSAYPELSILAVNAHTAVRRGLAAPSCMDAATWLLRVQGVDRVEADRQFGEQASHAPALPLERIQGIILRGYGHMPEARYLLLRVDPARAKDALAWIGSLPLTSAHEGRRAEARPEPLLNLAFSVHGLRALGVPETLCQRFATPFVQGSDHPQRARINGDVGDSAPETWQWGARDRHVHLVLLVYAKTAHSADQHAAQLTAAAERSGVSCLATLQGHTLAGRKEHFGFRDGIGQPVVRGCTEGDESRAVPAGEFLLGHMDGYDNLAQAPEADNGLSFGHDGSYLVFRQLAQNVEGFWRHCAAQGGGDAAQAVAHAARFVGRWPSGASLVVHPAGDPKDARFEDEDDFSYLSDDEENDRYGARCPFSAHIRRTNPRDWNLGPTREESLALSARHRIIRRGRPYGAPLHDDLTPEHMIGKALTVDDPAPSERGLQFLCFNANIDRQFEFIQQHWCNNPSFAGLTDSPDPLLSGKSAFARFVRVVGSGYFFMPSIPTVALLAQGAFGAGPKLALEQPPDDEQEHVDRLVSDLRAKLERDYAEELMRRDAHPKMHGCVKATFTILPAPEALRVGLLKKPRSYEAWVRFSNQSGEAQADAKPDVRGCAIKLLDVKGPKLLDGQEQCTTHDFVLLSHDTFITRNVREFAQLISAVRRGLGAIAMYMLTHWRVLHYRRTCFKRHESVLDIDYFSATPYLLGSLPVRYHLRPVAPRAVQADSAADSPDFLRERMRARLANESVAFDFVVRMPHRAADIDVEDPSLRWPDAQCELHTVARLEIPAQSFDDEARRSFGENLSYNPWRCLPEHRPLGGINRARRQVYRALSLFRHTRNAAPMVEPVLEQVSNERFGGV